MSQILTHLLIAAVIAEFNVFAIENIHRGSNWTNALDLMRWNVINCAICLAILFMSLLGLGMLDIGTWVMIMVTGVSLGMSIMSKKYIENQDKKTSYIVLGLAAGMPLLGVAFSVFFTF